MRARARIYAAHPMTCYGSPHEVACLDALRKLVPGVLINPAEVFASSAEWLVSWPRLIRRLDAMVAFPASDGTVGAGVVRELLDAVVYGIPVASARRRCAGRAGRCRHARASQANGAASRTLGDRAPDQSDDVPIPEFVPITTKEPAMKTDPREHKPMSDLGWKPWEASSTDGSI